MNSVDELARRYGVTGAEHAEMIARARMIARADAINDIERACEVMDENELAADRADTIAEMVGGGA